MRYSLNLLKSSDIYHLANNHYLNKLVKYIYIYSNDWGKNAEKETVRDQKKMVWGKFTNISKICIKFIVSRGLRRVSWTPWLCPCLQGPKKFELLNNCCLKNSKVGFICIAIFLYFLILFFMTMCHIPSFHWQ